MKQNFFIMNNKQYIGHEQRVDWFQILTSLSNLFPQKKVFRHHDEILIDSTQVRQISVKDSRSGNIITSYKMMS